MAPLRREGQRLGKEKRHLVEGDVCSPENAGNLHCHESKKIDLWVSSIPTVVACGGTPQTPRNVLLKTRFWQASR